MQLLQWSVAALTLFVSAGVSVAIKDSGISSQSYGFESYAELNYNSGFFKSNRSALSSSLNRRTALNTAGIGIEFETQSLLLKNLYDGFKEDDMGLIKGQEVNVGGMGWASGKYWKGTAEHTVASHIPHSITVEFIIDGLGAKLGTNSAAESAREISHFILNWQPSATLPSPQNSITVRGFENCGSWKITKPSRGDGNLEFGIQATTSMPLSMIWEIFKEARSSGLAQKNPLLNAPLDKLEMLRIVRQEHLDPWRPTDWKGEWKFSPDLLGFLSLVTTYVKATKGMNSLISPKMLTTIMPRTDFVKMYHMVFAESLAITTPWHCLKFQDLIRFLLIFELGNDPMERDLSGIFDIPGYHNHASVSTIEQQLAQRRFSDMNAFHFPKSRSLPVAKWLDNMHVTDWLSTYDAQLHDGQIGGLKQKTEGIYGRPDQEAPVFEFRDLAGAPPQEFESRVTAIQEKVEELHKAAPRPGGGTTLGSQKSPPPSPKTGNTCSAHCPEGQAQTGKNGKCEKCKEGFEPSKDQKKCIQTCAEDEAKTGTQGKCEKCKAGYVPSGDQKSCNKRCPSGQAGSGQNGKCQKCKADEEASADNKKCVKKCPLGSIRDKLGRCFRKPKGPKPTTTETHKHHTTESHKSEPTESHKPERTESHKSEATEPHQPQETGGSKPHSPHHPGSHPNSNPSEPESEQPVSNKPPPKQPAQSPMQPATHGNGGHGTGGRGRGGRGRL